jgi:hypothetical protein
LLHNAKVKINSGNCSVTFRNLLYLSALIELVIETPLLFEAGGLFKNLKQLKQIKMTKVSYLFTKTEPKFLTGIRVETRNDNFVVPVVDVRRGDDARRKISSMEKAVNMQTGSKFFKSGYSENGRPY